MNNKRFLKQYILLNLLMFVMAASAATSSYPPIIQATIAGDLQSVHALIRSGERPETTGSNGSMAIHHAAEHGHTLLVKYFLVRHNMHPDVRGWNNGTPLHWAARRGHLKTANYLLNAGASIDLHDITGATPLFWAFVNGKERVIKFLLLRGADSNVREAKNGGFPLHFAAKFGLADIIDLLAARGHDINVRTRTGTISGSGITPLHVACFFGTLKAVQALLRHRCDLSAADEIGYTALHDASEGGSHKIVQELLENGALVDARDIDGETPLHKVCRLGCYEFSTCGDYEDKFSKTISVLVKHGADVHAKNKRDVMPLQQVCLCGYARAAEHLLRGGADPNCVDIGPLVFIRHTELIAMLLAYGLQLDSEHLNRMPIKPRFSGAAASSSSSSSYAIPGRFKCKID